jgi:hypothetical protein
MKAKVLGVFGVLLVGRICMDTGWLLVCGSAALTWLAARCNGGAARCHAHADRWLRDMGTRV